MSRPDSQPRIANFSPGPAVLPEAVLAELEVDIWSYRSTGMGILEHSHRGRAMTKLLEETRDLCRELAGIPSSYQILFLSGGASTQFFMLPMNFLGPGRRADYTNTGIWSTRAIEEARSQGEVNVAFDGSRTGFDHVPGPDELSPQAEAAYLHYTSNNTIYGTQFPEPPSSESPLVADASSDLFSRPWPVERHAVIYASAQKNIGAAGVTLVLIREDFLDRARGDLPPMLRYRAHAEAGSCLNTPPVVGIYVMNRMLAWLRGAQGGLDALARRNREKADRVYAAVDGSGGYYRPVARADSRSVMNVCFRTPSAEDDARLVKEAEEAGFSGLKGHRAVGGLRASLYNACSLEACQELARFLSDFARKS